MLTTGNFVGFDTWLSDSRSGDLVIETGHASGRITLAELGPDAVVLDAGGLERQIRVGRLPNACRQDRLSHRIDVDLKPVGDNPIWVRVTTEDGFVAWSSPIYLFRDGA